MRIRHVFAVAITVGAIVANPVAARADGGAYMEFDRTHYLPGETATAEAYVYLLKPQQHLLERGPFYVYLVTDGSIPQAGRPIPGTDIRVGTFQIEQSRPKWFELQVSFTVPNVVGDFYTVAMCNDPCTTPGFKEPILGYISIVQTAREGALLTQQQRLRNRIYALRRAGKKQEKVVADLQGQLEALDLVRSSMASQMSAMEDRLAAPAAVSTRDRRPRPLLAPSTGIALVLALFALAALIIGRKQRRASVPALGATHQEERRRDQHEDQWEPVHEFVEPRSHAITSSRSVRR